MQPIGEAVLRRIMPRIQNAPGWLPALNEAMQRYAVNTEYRAAAFLAQVAHESAELSRLQENLNYSAKGLMATWPKRFPTRALALQYERKPDRIASYVYANRLGNGPVAGGDGWRYRGRGLIQLTGRGNYRTAGQALGLPLEQDPDALLQPRAAALSAAYFWQSRGLNELADDRNDGDDDEDFVYITRIINGGTLGLADRREYWRRAWTALGIA